MDRIQDATTTISGNDRLDLIGRLGGGAGLAFQGSVKVIHERGRLDTFPERIAIEKADAVTLVLAA